MLVDKIVLQDRFKGVFVTTGMGNAWDATTEAWRTQEIIDYYSKLVVTDFVDSSINVYVEDNLSSEVTNDTSQTYEIDTVIINSCPILPLNVGPITRHVIEELKNGANPVELEKLKETHLMEQPCVLVQQMLFSQ